MILDFLLAADTRADFETMAKGEGWMTEDGWPTEGVTYDPTPGTPEYETGIPMPDPVVTPVEVADPRYDPITGFHFNCRVSGDLAYAQTDGVPQTDANGVLLPLRQRTHFGQWMSELGKEKLHPNQHTTYTLASHVYFIDPETVWSPQRVWQ